MSCNPRSRITENSLIVLPTPVPGYRDDRRDDPAPDRRHRRPHTPIVDAVSRADPHAWSRRVNTRLGSGVSFDEDEETHEQLRRGMASDEGRWTTWRWTRDDDDDDDDDEEY